MPTTPPFAQARADGRNAGEARRPLVLAIGNSIMSDDGVGPALLARLLTRGLEGQAELVDGGTSGLSLLPFLEDTDHVVILDAARLGHAPGTVSVLRGADFDAVLGGNKTTAHEVALSDLIGAAEMTGGRPMHAAMVAVEPSHVRVGITLSPVVEAALPEAEAAVRAILKEWTQ